MYFELGRGRQSGAEGRLVLAAQRRGLPTNDTSLLCSIFVFTILFLLDYTFVSTVTFHLLSVRIARLGLVPRISTKT